MESDCGITGPLGRSVRRAIVDNNYFPVAPSPAYNFLKLFEQWLNIAFFIIGWNDYADPGFSSFRRRHRPALRLLTLLFTLWRFSLWLLSLRSFPVWSR